ncbi:MAG: efflux RND transporter permease subunit [Gemmatimonadetes bacterium]|nr:efflux RND transporter permease subunit [Gemmatimonadota bacterium]
MFLSDISIKRPVFATMMMVALVVLGVVSYKRLAVDEYPDVTYPTISVSVSYPGASPEVVERDVSRPIETALNTVDGLYELTSTSSEGSANVRLQFKLGIDPTRMQPEVSAKVGRIRRQLPRDINEPTISRYDPNDQPILTVAMSSSERSLRELTDLGDQVIRPRLESVNGVGGVQLNGTATREIHVEVDPNALRAAGLTPDVISSALARENQEVPAGRIKKGDNERAVRVTGRVTDPIAFQDVVVVVRAGTPIRVRDLGHVIDTIAERRSASFVGRGDKTTPTLSLDVLKISGSNTVAVANNVKAVIGDIERQLPADVRLTLTRDDSRHIKDSLADVQLTIGLGAVLTVMIIYLFLNSWRSTVITGLTLPVSIISAFFAMFALGFTINTMTLLALSLAIGLLIDDAIVVRENIVRHLGMGKDHHRAAKDGTDEIGLAVFATTLAVVAVFIPVAFMGGTIGKIFYQFGMTVAFAVLVSLFVSFTLDPMLSSVWHDPEAMQHGGDAWRSAGFIRKIALRFDRWFERTADRYPHMLATALRHRGIVVVGALASIALAAVIIPRLGFTWMPDFDGGEFNVSFRVAPGSSLSYVIARGKPMDDFIRSMPEVDFTAFSNGGRGGGINNGNISVRLKPRNQRKRSQFEVQTALRAQLSKFPGISASIGQTPTIFGGRGAPITVNVQGPEPARLKLIASQVLEVMKRIPGIAEPQSSDEGSVPQLNVSVDRQQAWAAGLGIASIASTLQPLFTGQRATVWQDPLGYSHDVVVIYPDSLRSSAADVANIPVNGSGIDSRTGLPAVVPLSQVADVVPGVGPQSIERRALERQIRINAQVLPGAPVGDIADVARAAIDSLVLPPGYRTVFTGSVQELNDTKGYVAEALALAVVFIYLILASLFGSFLQPLAIMISLPLSFLGVGLGLLVTRGTMNVMSMIGIIMLMGLVTKNGILLLDFVNQRRAEGEDRLAAILEAGRIRLRPIIMTTVAMIFGMLPLAFAIGEGAEQRAPMAHAVIGGLITSTLLTLFVVPVVYTLLDDMAVWVGGGRRPVATTETESENESGAVLAAVDARSHA